MQTRKDARQFPQLSQAAAIWQTQFRNPFELLNSLLEITQSVHEASLINSKENPSDKTYQDTHYFLKLIMQEMAIPAIDESSGFWLEKGLSALVTSFGPESIHKEVTNVLNCIGLTNNQDGSYNDDIMSRIITVIYGLSRIAIHIKGVSEIETEANHCIKSLSDSNPIKE